MLLCDSHKRQQWFLLGYSELSWVSDWGHETMNILSPTFLFSFWGLDGNVMAWQWDECGKHGFYEDQELILEPCRLISKNSKGQDRDLQISARVEITGHIWLSCHADYWCRLHMQFSNFSGCRIANTLTSIDMAGKPQKQYMYFRPFHEAMSSWHCQKRKTHFDI